MVYKPCYNGNSSTAAPAFKDYYMVLKVFWLRQKVVSQQFTFEWKLFCFAVWQLGIKISGQWKNSLINCSFKAALAFNHPSHLENLLVKI